MKVEKMVLNAFKNGIFPILPKKGTGVPGMQDSRSTDLASSSSPKILTPKHASKITNSTSTNLLNEIRQIIYSLYPAKKLLKNHITIS